MGHARTLKLFSRGVLRLFDSDNSASIGLKAPAAVGADFDWVLPAADAVGYIRSDGAGNLSLTAATATLDGAYDSGKTITVDAGKVALNGAAGLVEEVLSILAAANHEALILEKTGVGAGSVLKLTNAGTGYGVEVIQNGNAVAHRITQNEATKAALQISGGSASIDADKPILAGDKIVVANNKGLKEKVAGGTERFSIIRDNSDWLNIGDPAVNQPVAIVTGASYIQLSTNGSSRMIVASDGKVGIGMTPLEQGLDVYTGATTPAVISLRTNEQVSGVMALRFICGTGAQTGNNLVAQIRATIEQSDPSALKGALRFYTNIGDTSAENMTIDSAGRVGITVSVPSHLLHIENSVTYDYRCLHLKTNRPSVGAYVEANYDIQALYLKKNTGVGNTNSVLHFDNQTTADTITTSQGNEKLTQAGVWTDRSCFVELKTDILPIATDNKFLEKFSRLSFQKYVDKSFKELGGIEAPRHGLFLDELVSEFGFGSNGISGTEVASLAVGGVKALVAALDTLTTRVTALEAK